jgi:hypothetical protein
MDDGAVVNGDVVTVGDVINAGAGLDVDVSDTDPGPAGDAGQPASVDTSTSSRSVLLHRSSSSKAKDTVL